MVKPEIRPSKDLFAAVHVQLQLYSLADPQIAELGFLEIRVYPDITQRADGHEALATWTLLPGLTLRRVITPSISATTVQ